MLSNRIYGRRRRLVLLVAFGLMATLVMGAHSVTHELLSRPQQRDQAWSQARRLSTTLAAEMHVPAQSQWRTIAQEHPFALLQACSQTR